MLKVLTTAIGSALLGLILMVGYVTRSDRVFAYEIEKAIQPYATPVTETAGPKLEQHIVRKGDWLSTIALDRHVSRKALPAYLAEVKRLNPVIADVDRIRPGWVITLPDPTQFTSATTTSPEKSVVKKQKASPEKIAKAVTRDKLQKSKTGKKIARHGKSGKIRRPADMIDTYHDVIGVLAPQIGVDTSLAYAIPWQESGGKACVKGDKGASVGLWQFKAGTIRSVGYSPSDRCNPVIATKAGLEHLRDNYQSLKRTAQIHWPQLFKRPDWQRVLSDAAIAAHNGPYWAEQAIRNHQDPARWGKTQEYVRVIRAHQKTFERVLANRET